MAIPICLPCPVMVRIVCESLAMETPIPWKVPTFVGRKLTIGDILNDPEVTEVLVTGPNFSPLSVSRFEMRLFSVALSEGTNNKVLNIRRLAHRFSSSVMPRSYQFLLVTTMKIRVTTLPLWPITMSRREIVVLSTKLQVMGLFICLLRSLFAKRR